MRVTEDGWNVVPDFSVQLQAAMDYAGLDARQVAAALDQLGIKSHPQKIHRLLKGDIDRATGKRKRANPTFVLIGGLAMVCHVPVAWFFDATTGLTELIERYGQRAASEDETSGE